MNVHQETVAGRKPPRRGRPPNSPRPLAEGRQKGINLPYKWFVEQLRNGKSGLSDDAVIAIACSRFFVIATYAKRMVRTMGPQAAGELLQRLPWDLVARLEEGRLGGALGKKGTGNVNDLMVSGYRTQDELSRLGLGRRGGPIWWADLPFSSGTRVIELTREAVRTGDRLLFSSILSCVSFPAEFDAGDGTPMIIALAKRVDPAMLEMFIGHGLGWEAKYRRIGQGIGEEEGSEGKRESRFFDTGVKDSEGYAAIHHAAELGRAGPVRALIRAKAYLDARVEKTGETALMLAADTGHQDIVSTLLKAGADPTLKANPERKLVLKEGVVVIKDDGLTAADYAKGAGETKLEELLRKAANNFQGTSPKQKQ